MTTDLGTLISTALEASAEAALAADAELGGDHGDCGSAWVVLTARKGRKALVEALKARDIRVKKHFAGGVAIHILGRLHRVTQCRLPFERGCDAFADTLREAGFEAYVHSYAD